MVPRWWVLLALAGTACAKALPPVGRSVAVAPARGSSGSVDSELAALRLENAALKRALVGPRRTAGRLWGGGVGGGGGGGNVNNFIGNYNDDSVGQLILERGGWLAVFLISLSLTSVVMSEFEHTLAEHIELSYFVPLLIGHGGNAGGQTVGTVLGALSAGDVHLADWPRVVLKECLAGLGAGTITCGAMLPLLHVMKISKHVSTVVLITLPVLTVRFLFLPAGQGQATQWIFWFGLLELACPPPPP